MRLRLLSKKAIQFGLPAVVLMLPILVNPYGYHFYKVPKVPFFRFSILLLLTAWLVDRINVGEFAASLRRLLTRPLVLPVLLFALAYVLATVASIDPHLSFWGSYIRVSGNTYNFLCYAIFFFLIILNLHTPRQLEWLITVALLASLAVALYGVLQHSGFDPLFPEHDCSSRVISTIGNPIFLGAYLIMVIPLALGRLLASLRALLRSQPAASRRSALLEAIGYASLLALQSACLLYTKSRGPWLGFWAGMALFAILIALRRRMKGLLILAVVVNVASIAFLVLLNLPQSPLEPLKALPYLSRLVILDDLKATSGTVGVRLFIWQGEIELLRLHPNIGPAPDQLSFLRPLIGYGPEAMKLIFRQVHPPGLFYVESRTAMIDRAHNELLDLLVTTGAMGLLAFLFLMGSFFYYGLSLLRRTGAFSTQVTLVALLSAMFAHLVEAQFGILLPATEMLLWLYLALVSAMSIPEGVTEHKETAVAITEANPGNASRLRAILSLLVVCVIPFFASLSNIDLLLADIYLGRGARFQSAGRWKESIAAYNKAIQLFPGQSRFYQLKADAYYQLAQSIADDEVDLRGQLLQTSADALARARELEPLEPMYYGGAGKVYSYWARTVDPSKFEQAIAFYNEALELSPHDTVYRSQLVQLYFDTGQYEKAIRQCQICLDIDPKFTDAHYNLGIIYLTIGEKEKAEEHFQTALRLDPQCEECARKLKSLQGD
ncbi:MAG: tetratricopeptide repeat protein [Chloroflexota bacterium]|nr:tetratricopeptide repeat protein [Chloroflexota bacterium]